MGVKTLANFRTDVYLGMDTRNEFDPTTALGAARLDDAINKAYRHVCLPNIYEHPEMQSTFDITLATGTSNYTLVAAGVSVWAIHQVKLEADEVVLPAESFRILNSRRLNSRRPSRYARWANTLYLDSQPTADENGDTLRVYHWLQPTDLSAVGDQTVLTQVWDQIITEGAKYYAWLGIGQIERADAMGSVFGTLINEIGAIDRIEGQDEGYSVDPSGPITRTPYMQGARG